MLLVTKDLGWREPHHLRPSKKFVELWGNYNSLSFIDFLHCFMDVLDGRGII